MAEAAAVACAVETRGKRLATREYQRTGHGMLKGVRATPFDPMRPLRSGRRRRVEDGTGSEMHSFFKAHFASVVPVPAA
jgi:hypothetical protein